MARACLAYLLASSLNLEAPYSWRSVREAQSGCMPAGGGVRGVGVGGFGVGVGGGGGRGVGEGGEWVGRRGGGGSEAGDEAITLFFLPHPRGRRSAGGGGKGPRAGFRRTFSVMRVCLGRERESWFMVQDAVILLYPE